MPPSRARRSQVSASAWRPGAEHRGVAELAAKIAALGGTSIPVRSLRQVASDHQAFFVVAPHQVHRFRVALLGRLPIQRIGARLVLGHAAAGGVEIGQVVAGPVKAGLGGDPIVDGCRGWIRRAAPAMFKTASEHIARHCVAAFGGDREPGPRQGRVALDALAVRRICPSRAWASVRPSRAAPRMAWATSPGVPASCAAKPSASSAS